MGQVIELCRRCGFDIPADAEGCPGCGLGDDAPLLAARQVAGLALPTRSVHRLPGTPPRKERRPRRTVGPARGARSAFEYTSSLVIIVLLGMISAWVAGLDHFVLAVPTGTVERINGLTQLAAWATVIVGAIGLIALAIWCVRRLAVGVAHRRHDAPA